MSQFMEKGKTPLYRGKLKAIHEDCPFVFLATRLDCHFKLNILHPTSDNAFVKVRFFINGICEKLGLEEVISSLKLEENIKSPRVWIGDNGTAFELLAKDVFLNELLSLENLPFFQITDYDVSDRLETVVIIFPSQNGCSGIDFLRERKSRLERISGSVDIEAFEKLEERDIPYNQNPSLPYWKGSLTLEESKILELAINEGYFKTRSWNTIEKLARMWDLRPEAMKKRLENIEERAIRDFMEELRQPLHLEVG